MRNRLSPVLIPLSALASLTALTALTLLLPGSWLAAQDQQPEPADSAAVSPPAVAPAEPAEVPSEPVLVPLSAAVSAGRRIKVAAMVDHESHQAGQVDGKQGYAFTLYDHEGTRLRIESIGAPPIGLELNDVVVVAGQGSGEVLRADAVLIPGAADWPDPNRGLWSVMVISMIVWLGLFAYVLWLDYKRRRLEVQ